jgi:outer membrane protein assembly factor BamB
VAAVVVQWLLWAGVPLVAPDYAGVGVLGGVAGGLVVLVWWLFFSRAPWAERLGAIALMIVAVLVTKRIVHISISNGLMGMMLAVYSIPPVSLALVASAAVGRSLSSGARRAVMAIAILLACGVFTIVRTGGITGAGTSDLHWRWTATAEERLLAQAADEPPAPAARETTVPAPAPASVPPPEKPTATTAERLATPPEKPVATSPDKPAAPKATDAVDVPAADPARRSVARWPGFRGLARDGVVRGVRIETDWARKPPIQVWRHPIGPGWSSFAVDGDLIYTQEQRGEHEVVSCYRLSTGEPVWRHRDAVRFYESNGGAGPRATPTVRDGRVYTQGATGIVNALDARKGAVLWSRNAAIDTGAPLPGWGFAGSPLLVDDVVIVAASGRLVAYDVGTGNPRWVRQTGGGGYSSPHLATIDGVTQILLLSSAGATSIAPADGSVLWRHQWEQSVAIIQPAVISDGQILISLGDMMGGVGMRRLAVTQGSGGWTAEERWTSRGLKPYFNDFVVHKGHAFGFDGTILSCINLEDGERRWKGGRYGAGQMVLLSDQDLLLVLSEEGELALVSATPDKHTELARFKTIEGKTWNHPVLVGDVLLVRNGEEMAAFRLPLLKHE